MSSSLHLNAKITYAPHNSSFALSCTLNTSLIRRALLSTISLQKTVLFVVVLLIYMYFYWLLSFVYMPVGMCFKVTQNNSSRCDFCHQLVTQRDVFVSFYFLGLIQKLTLFYNYVKCDSKLKSAKQGLFKEV